MFSTFGANRKSDFNRMQLIFWFYAGLLGSKKWVWAESGRDFEGAIELISKDFQQSLFNYVKVIEIENPRVGGSIPPQATKIFKEKPTLTSWLFCFVWAVSGLLGIFNSICLPIDCKYIYYKKQLYVPKNGLD